MGQKDGHTVLAKSTPATWLQWFELLLLVNTFFKSFSCIFINMISGVVKAIYNINKIIIILRYYVVDITYNDLFWEPAELWNI